jgi:hypothetical protein
LISSEEQILTAATEEKFPILYSPLQTAQYLQTSPLPTTFIEIQPILRRCQHQNTLYASLEAKHFIRQVVEQGEEKAGEIGEREEEGSNIYIPT